MNIEEQMMGSNPYTDVPWSFPKHLEAFTGGEVTDVYRGRKTMSVLKDSPQRSFFAFRGSTAEMIN
jgi:hypothetical protein